MEATNQSILDDAVNTLLAGNEPIAEETETEEVEVDEAEEADEESDESEQYEEEDDDSEGDDEEYEEEDEQQADQLEPSTYAIKVDGEDVSVTLDDLKQSYSGQQFIQKGMRQAAEQRKQAEEAYNSLTQQRAQLDQFMQQMQTQGVLREPTAPTRELFNDDPLSYMDADLQYKEDLRAFQGQQQQAQANYTANQQAQQHAQKANLQEQVAELSRLIPEFSDAQKAPIMKDKLLKQGIAQGYSQEEMSSIVDARAMGVLHKAMLYDQMVEGKSNVQGKLKKARPLIKAGAKKQAPSAKKAFAKQHAKMKESGSMSDAVELLFMK